MLRGNNRTRHGEANLLAALILVTCIGVTVSGSAQAESDYSAFYAAHDPTLSAEQILERAWKALDDSKFRGRSAQLTAMSFKFDHRYWFLQFRIDREQCGSDHVSITIDERDPDKIVIK